MLPKIILPLNLRSWAYVQDETNSTFVQCLFLPIYNKNTNFTLSDSDGFHQL